MKFVWPAIIALVAAAALVLTLSAVTVSSSGTITRVSVDSAGNAGNGHSDSAAVSGDGRYVAFASHSDNLVPGDTNGLEDAFVHDRVTGVTERVSVTTDEAQTTAGYDTTPIEVAITPDGRYVAFSSDAWDLVPSDTNLRSDIFLRDRQAGTTARVSVSGTNTQLCCHSSQPTISADGRYVAFACYCENGALVYVRDVQSSTLSTYVGGSAGSPAISADGSYVATTFRWSVPGEIQQIVVRETQNLSAVEYVSKSSAGELGTADSYNPSISADGRYVAFDSVAGNLVAGDTGGCRIYGNCPDVFVHDRQTGITEKVSVDSGEQPGNEESRSPSISADGRFVAFRSYATNLAPGAGPGVYLRDRQSGTTSYLAPGNLPELSSAAEVATFHAQSTLLPGGSSGDVRDVYIIEVGGDGDSDGILDYADNCPAVANPAQADADADGVGDACDNCPSTPNGTQANLDGDGLGDACDSDDDNDTVPDASANCPAAANQSQLDTDGDLAGDACDADDDNDTLADGQDPCPTLADCDGDTLSDPVDPCPQLQDCDGDGVFDVGDNCPTTSNPNQADSDGDALGDACEPCLMTPSECVDRMAIDTEDEATPANTATSIGSVEVCRRINNNDVLDADEDAVDALDVDVVVGPDGIPAAKEMTAFSFVLKYNNASLAIVAENIQMLAANAGSSVVNLMEPTPDTDGAFYAAALDTSYTAGETGDGVLTRFQVEAASASPVATVMKLSEYATLDYYGNVVEVQTAYAAVIALDSACPSSDGDGDTIPDAVDNCPSTFNPDQADNEGDGIGDACDPDDDNAGVYDRDEMACGADPFVAAIRPERIDGPFAGIDDDGDTQVDDTLPPGTARYDCDGDGFKGSAEDHVFGSAVRANQDPCGTNGWPAELVAGSFSANKINISDVANFVVPLRHLNTDVGTLPGDVRWDLAPGSTIGKDINVSDMAALTTGPSAYPAMLGGQRAFNGPVCPWAP